jgi:hypothetical protein
LKTSNKVNLILLLAALIYISCAIRFYIFPLLSTDAAWTLSSLYDYLKHPNLSTSMYAHEYLGPIFNFNTLHFLLGPIFSVFELNTLSFIICHFVIIAISSILLWLLITDKLMASLSILFYVADGYIYGMRSENYALLLALLIFLVWFKIKHKFLKLVIATLLILFIGFMHPVGGFLTGITFILLIYLDIHQLDNKNGYINVLKLFGQEIFKVGFVAVIALLLFGIDKSNNMVRVYLTPSGDTGNHFDGLHFNLFLKYAYLGNMFSLIVLLFLSFKLKEKFWFAYLLLFTIFLIISGRSYYFPYYTIPLVILLSGRYSSFKISQDINDFKFFPKVVIVCMVYVFTLNSLKLFSSLKSYDAGCIYKNVLKKITSIKKEKNNSLIFLPSQLSIEYYKNENQRIIFPSVNVIYKKQVPIGTNVYFFLSDQIEWIEGNPLIFGHLDNWRFDTIIPFAPGQYSLMGSISDSKPVNNVGLLKLTRIK